MLSHDIHEYVCKLVCYVNVILCVRANCRVAVFCIIITVLCGMLAIAFLLVYLVEHLSKYFGSCNCNEVDNHVTLFCIVSNPYFVDVCIFMSVNNFVFFPLILGNQKMLIVGVPLLLA